MKFDRLRFCRHGALLLSCLAFSCPSLGQDIDPSLITAEETRSSGKKIIVVPWGKCLPAPEELASHLFENCELVADGEFYALPESSPEELTALKRGHTLVRFRIHRLYKGVAPDAIAIQLENDMLIIPGEEISRYEKRRRILEEALADVEPVLEQTDALLRSLEAGEVDRQAFTKETERLNAIISERIGREGVVDWALIGGPSHGKTFYDLGGAIRPNERYLLGLNTISHENNAYGLSAFGRLSWIYWGETREYVLAASSLVNPNLAP